MDWLWALTSRMLGLPTMLLVEGQITAGAACPRPAGVRASHAARVPRRSPHRARERAGLYTELARRRRRAQISARRLLSARAAC